MWIMTEYGILMPAGLPADVPPEYTHGDFNHAWNLQVRARDRKPLEVYRRWCQNAGYGIWATSQVQSTPGRDYEFRVYTTKAEFGHYMSTLVQLIDYEKFKPTTMRPGRGGEKLHDLYNKIWGVVATHYDSKILETYGMQRRRKGRRSAA